MPLTIVMYHYVRDLARSRFPQIKAMTTDDFVGQIAYLQQHYQFITGDDLINALQTGSALPANACLLTFDDGYADHFDVVLPILQQHRLTGCFFPVARCVQDRVVLDVNKIHYILASVADKSALVNEARQLMDEHRPTDQLASFDDYWRRCGVANRFDPAEVVFLKRLLQRELPETTRHAIADELFRRHVSQDEAEFANELYMSLEQIRWLHQAGMTIGGHGAEHYWLDAITVDQQRNEIERTVQFLDQVGVDVRRWIMCYPYGAYNESLLAQLPQHGCIAGLTVEVDLADLSFRHPLTLPRLDCIDLPVEPFAIPNPWTQRVL